jgi:phospholipase/lecithinase/hemolysin
MNRAGLDLASHLTVPFNRTLRASLPADDRVLLVDAASFFDRMVADPSGYGFTNVIEDGCNNGSHFCAPEHYTTPNAANEYMFAGWGHLTAKTRQILAAEVKRQVLARWPGGARTPGTRP